MSRPFSDRRRRIEITFANTSSQEPLRMKVQMFSITRPSTENFRGFHRKPWVLWCHLFHRRPLLILSVPEVFRTPVLVKLKFCRTTMKPNQNYPHLHPCLLRTTWHVAFAKSRVCSRGIDASDLGVLMCSSDQSRLF